MATSDSPDRRTIARLAAAHAATEGVTALRAVVDLDQIYRLCDALNLTLPHHVQAVPPTGSLELGIHSPALQRTVVLQLEINDPNRFRATAIDRDGPDLRGPDVAGYLATAELTTLSLMAEVKKQLAGAARHVYQEAADRHLDDRLGATTPRDPKQAWTPGPVAIDALSALLEQDARWKAQLLINNWYVNAIAAAERGEVLRPNTGVQITSEGIRIDRADPSHTLPDSLRDLLNEHWRAVYVRTVHEQLGIVDALSTPGEQAMHNYLEAQAEREARRQAAEGFPDQPGHHQPPPAGPQRSPDDSPERDTGTGR